MCRYEWRHWVGVSHGNQPRGCTEKKERNEASVWKEHKGLEEYRGRTCILQIKLMTGNISCS